jgi:ABC-type proline/glycine betaine transport system permease subunit
LLGTIPVIILALVLDGALVFLETGIKKAVMHVND